MLADTLGSVGVIISSLLIEYLDWKIADPICSMCIAIMIFLSVVPLVRSTGSILLLETPSQYKALKGELAALPGVDHVIECHFWLLHDEKYFYFLFLKKNIRF